MLNQNSLPDNIRLKNSVSVHDILFSTAPVRSQNCVPPLLYQPRQVQRDAFMLLSINSIGKDEELPLLVVLTQV